MEISADFLREQRRRPAVLKLQLAGIRSSRPCLVVFVLEGRDDLRAYDVWLRRIDPGLDWAPLVANGKRNALEFREMLKRDTTGVAECTYFIVDHDYDGLARNSPGDDIYVLPMHSVENAVVDESALLSLLTTEFEVLGDLTTLQAIAALFKTVRERFAELILPSCVTLHASRHCAVGAVHVRGSCAELLKVELDQVSFLADDGAESLVTTEQELPPTNLDEARDFFRERPLHLWVRGKYLLQFFRVWCELLMEDRNAQIPSHFVPGLGRAGFSGHWLDMGALASRSRIPDGLADFVVRSRAECEANCTH